MLTNRSTELDALRAQVARLQAEKNDLVALNSELQLKADQNSQDDGSFIEIIRVLVHHTRSTTQLFTESRTDILILLFALRTVALTA